MPCRAFLALTDNDFERLARLPGGELIDEEHYMCELSAGHPGPHIALADYCALDEEPPFTSTWLNWDPAGYQVVPGISCTECALPASHPDGSGCSAPRYPHCGVTAAITAEEVERLNNLPNAVHEMDAERRCQLEAGHPGAHFTLLQSQEQEGVSKADWWLTWPGTHGPYEITVLEPCPHVGEEENLCLRPLGHPGSHDAGPPYPAATAAAG
ncbi:hypothetical protein [Kitasatospora sp. NPDC059571]|uniref:hypothetical protein n=1 Tax=Kitasatospora sp. NPDC059571 TaxID=3346871 RepID=UPI00369F4587